MVDIFKTCHFTLEINIFTSLSLFQLTTRLPDKQRRVSPSYLTLHVFVMFNSRSFRNCLLILLVASKFASASISEKFVKYFRIWHHWRSTGEPLRQVSCKNRCLFYKTYVGSRFKISTSRLTNS